MVVDAVVRYRASSAAQPRFLDRLRNAETDDLTSEYLRARTNSELRPANLATQRQVIVLGAQRRRHVVDTPRTETVRNRTGRT
jgi:hypothetical protein